MDQDGSHHPNIGARVREIRAVQGWSQQVVADRAKVRKSFISQVERGEKPVERRSTLDALAAALRVAPSDLAGRPIVDMLADPAVSAAQATIAQLESALVDIGFGDAVVAPRDWAAVAADLQRLNDELRPTTDYAAQGAVLPGLVAELQSLVGAPGVPQRDVMIGLVQCYHAAAVVTRNLGIRGLPALAAWHARRVAEELDDPAWLGLAAWLRSATVGGNRTRARDVAADAAGELQRTGLGVDQHRQMYGSLHLQAALSAAAATDTSAAQDHLAEAASVARPDDIGAGFGHLYFGPANLAIWRVGLAAELGDTDRARELAAGIDPADVPSAARQAAYWSDLGRSLATTKATRDDAVVALREAEDAAPVWTRTRPLVRETVTHLLPRVRRDTPAGRDLRGMAYRMGVAV
jgi:transcriptional regulator with XRE-family HTH domain